jgi:hypothetical protein
MAGWCRFDVYPVSNIIKGPTKDDKGKIKLHQAVNLNAHGCCVSIGLVVSF